MDKARKALEKEVGIVAMIRSRRFVHMALQHLLQPALYLELEAKSSFHEILTYDEPGKKYFVD